ncbi:MAG TPA: PEPxxWA-CTERM sorting domain-containing protein [Sphingomicrobium sp.]|nr:PEPxxWA-CTERM sorting domain-containing protein [Sphingomicrobium sp.]
MIGKLGFCVASVAAVFSASSAQAQQASFNLSGSGISGSISLTYTPDPNTGPIGTSPNAFDPVGSYVVTGITGTFSDSNIGLTDAAITGIVPSNPGSPTADNLLAPHSFGFYLVANGVPGPDGTAPGFSYDGLFYPGGSPQTATSYPFSGGVFDIYGLVFTLSGGDSVDLWSNGNVPGTGLNYGVGVTDGTSVLDYASPVSLAAVPEPATWAMMLIGFGAIGLPLRAARRKRKLGSAAV